MIKKMKYLIFFGFVCIFIMTNTIQANTNNQYQKINQINNQTFSNTILYPIADSGIVQKYPDNTPGAADYMTIVNADTGWGRDALVRFDTSTIPSGGIILTAKLRLYYYEWGDNNPAGRLLNCYRITSDWDEATVSWNTQPSHATYPTASTRVPYRTNTWIEWDVKSDVKHFIEGNYDNYGWHIADKSSWSSYDIPRTRTRSKEYGQNIPELRVLILNTKSQNNNNLVYYTSCTLSNPYIYDDNPLKTLIDKSPLHANIIDNLIYITSKTNV